jgi:hypothetical protein
MRFFGLFLACIDTSRSEYKPLVVLNFNGAPLILDNYFKF